MRWADSCTGPRLSLPSCLSCWEWGGGLPAHPQGITLCQKKPPAQVHPFLQAVLPSTGPLEFKGLPGCLGLGRFLKDHSPELQQLKLCGNLLPGPLLPQVPFLGPASQQLPSQSCLPGS